MKKRIILTGFMGTGKSAVGNALAKLLGYGFLDTDLMVEEFLGKSVTEIFEKEGEPTFRDAEKKMLRKALGKDKVVVATGGGAVIDEVSRKLMREKGVLIALSASPEVILERVTRFDTRPLLKGGQKREKMEKIKNLLSTRSPFYREADHILDTTNKSLDETVQEIRRFLDHFS